MKKSFSPKNALRSGALGQIKYFYAEFGVQVEIFEKRSFAKNLEGILEKQDQTPPSVQKEIEDAIRQIALLACKVGIGIVDQIAPVRNGFAWDYFFRPNATYFQKSMWLWLTNRPLFDEALGIFCRLSAKKMLEKCGN